MNKKGSMLDLLFWMAICILIIVVTVVCYFVFSKLNDNVQSSPGYSTQAKQIMQSNKDRYVSTFDGIFLMILVGFFIVACIGAYFLYTHPVLYWLFWPLIILIIIIAAIIANLGYEVVHSSAFEPYLNEFHIIPFVLNNWIRIITIMVLLFFGIMFAKRRQEGQ